ncbi:Protein root UVB sensitive 6 [Zea mays]|uniref:Protein root UVB sensitive 6 n=1 Tax=Zea mays TaxID=4577 RepID=A0A1D6N5B3_MAIZE|nr:Protein root UVB sensitive 6 [Zea mays]
MAPAVGLKRSATQTITLPPPDTRLAVRDVMRSTIPSQPAVAPASTERQAPAAALQGFLCLEEVDGRRWSYVVDGGAAKGRSRGGAVPAGAAVRAVTSFAFLSCGYLLSSYQEVRSVVLNTLNRARFTVAVDSFIKTGHIPSLKEGNSQETIFNPPWRHEPVAIGSRFGEAFQEPASFLAIRPLFEDERYMVTYNPTKDKVYALLKDQAKSDDIIKAAFHAHVLLHFINASHARRLKQKQKQANPDRSEYLYSRNMDFLAHIAESCKIVSSSYGTFKKKAREQGWIMSESLLNPGKARLCAAKPQ